MTDEPKNQLESQGCADDLPRLNPLIRIFAGPDKPDGTPSWTLYHPAGNQYFQIGWAEFECLSRLTETRNAKTLVARVNEETPLEIDMQDLEALLVFLQQNGLLEGSSAQAPPDQSDPLWKKILHRYLFFSIPLIRPQHFLKTTYPYMRFFMSRVFLVFTGILLAVLVLLTLGRLDQFTHTFLQLFSFEGAALLFVTLAVVKIFHEFGHAYVATRHDVDIPHMGIAFMVMYPVLYTETSAAWRIPSRRGRIQIGLAGIFTEMILATYALLLWHVLPPGLLQSLAFSVVVIALVGSLLVNLNPLMRFDGYFVLSDSLGIENLHARGFAFARWWLRRFLFNFEDPVPESFSAHRQRFLIIFGFATLIYRFFLFLGIALLVYWLFFKPLGLILMIVELWWFIVMPVTGELKIWWGRRHEILGQRRGKLAMLGGIAVLIYFFLPVHRTIQIPAVAHAYQYRGFHAPETAVVEMVAVKDGQNVKEGDVLLVLRSPILDKNIAKTQTELEALYSQKRLSRLGGEGFRDRGATIEREIEAWQKKLDSLQDKKQGLSVKAPFPGTIREVFPNLQKGQTVSPEILLLRLVDLSRWSVSGYIDAYSLQRIETGQQGKFYPDYSYASLGSLVLSRIDAVNADSIMWPSLSSIYAGPIPSEWDPSPENTGQIKPRSSLYTVDFKQSEIDGEMKKQPDFVMKGTVKLSAKRHSPMLQFIRRAGAIFIRELNLN